MECPWRGCAYIHCCFKLLCESVALQVKDVRLMRPTLLAFALQDDRLLSRQACRRLAQSLPTMHVLWRYD